MHLHISISFNHWSSVACCVRASGCRCSLYPIRQCMHLGQVFHLRQLLITSIWCLCRKDNLYIVLPIWVLASNMCQSNVLMFIFCQVVSLLPSSIMQECEEVTVILLLLPYRSIHPLDTNLEMQVRIFCLPYFICVLFLYLKVRKYSDANRLLLQLNFIATFFEILANVTSYSFFSG